MDQEHDADAVVDRRDRTRSAEWADTQPALFRSEGFFEDLLPEPTPTRSGARPARVHSSSPQLLGRMLGSVLRLRRT